MRFVGISKMKHILICKKCRFLQSFAQNEILKFFSVVTLAAVAAVLLTVVAFVFLLNRMALVLNA